MDETNDDQTHHSNSEVDLPKQSHSYRKRPLDFTAAGEGQNCAYHLLNYIKGFGWENMLAHERRKI